MQSCLYEAKSSPTFDIWRINDSVFVGDGNLEKDMDIYLVDLHSKHLSFMKLDSEITNLKARFCILKENGRLAETGWEVDVNSVGYINVPAGKYAIIVSSENLQARGKYKLMWNCSNPPTAKKIVYYNNDLSNVILYYDRSMICMNGNNILEKLKWEEDTTQYFPNGYTGRSMAISLVKDGDGKVLGVKDVYLASFSSTMPYSTSNALLIEVNYASWLYMQSYYKNVNGNVQHVMDYKDLSGLETPRTFGTGADDFSYGPSYIVINLDKAEVCDFLSPFNYNYTEQGGRKFTLSNLHLISN